MAGEVRRLGEHGELFWTELLLPVGLGEQFEALLPGFARQCLSGSLEARFVARLSHGFFEAVTILARTLACWIRQCPVVLTAARRLEILSLREPPTRALVPERRPSVKARLLVLLPAVLIAGLAETTNVSTSAFLLPEASTGGAASDVQQDSAQNPVNPNWVTVYHQECCEGNLAAYGPNTYVLLPELESGNDIKRSTDGGHTYQKVYPPVDVSVPFGIEGDLAAFGDDVTFFGTELL